MVPIKVDDTQVMDLADIQAIFEAQIEELTEKLADIQAHRDVLLGKTRNYSSSAVIRADIDAYLEAYQRYSNYYGHHRR